MNFRTEIETEKGKFPVLHSYSVLTIGSCFAENIADKMILSKFRTLKNPFGVLYNPISIFNSLKHVFSMTKFGKEDLIFDQEEWHSFFHHSDFSHHDSEAVLEKINNAIETTRYFIEKASVVIITYGTSKVYKHIDKNIIVSNCHKIPSNQFINYRLSLEETVNSIEKTMMLLREMNNSLKIIFTVSPVRHWKDGAHGNQLNKAVLLLGIDKIVEHYDFTEYFPSYELLMDDLRDYRFYDKDMLHPNDVAVEYIWEKFAESYFSEDDRKLMK